MRSWVTVRRHAASSATYSCTPGRRGLQLSAPRGTCAHDSLLTGSTRVRADVMEPSDTTHTEKNEPIRTNEHTEPEPSCSSTAASTAQQAAAHGRPLNLFIHHSAAFPHTAVTYQRRLSVTKPDKQQIQIRVADLQRVERRQRGHHAEEELLCASQRGHHARGGG